MSEIDLQRLFLLEAPRILPGVRLFRRNVGLARMGNRKVRFGITGQCDLYAIVKGGRIIEIEIKSISGTLSKEQKNWRDFCNRMGRALGRLQTIAQPDSGADDGSMV